MAVMRSTPPFRADHVGSLLRPPELLAARDDFAAGRIDAAQLRASRTGDRRGRRHAGGGRPAVRPPTASSAGPPGTWTSSTSWAAISKAPGNLAVKFQNPAGRHRVHPGGAAGRPARSSWTTRSSRTTSATCSRVVTSATPKLTIPSPNMVHYRGGPAAIDPAVYPDMEEFWSDLSAAYAEQVRPAGRAGLHLPAARRHQPGLPQRPGAAGRDRRAGRGRRAPAPALHPAGQRRDRGPAATAWR